MKGLITIGQAAERLGVTRQTVINWSNSGIIKIHNIAGKQYWLDANSVEALKDSAKETNQQIKRLKEYKETLREEADKLESLVYDIKRDLHLVKGTAHIVASLDFYLSIPAMLYTLGVLTEREARVVEIVIKDGFAEASKEFGVAQERIRQIFVKAIRKSRDLTEIKERLAEIDKVKEDNQILKAEVSALEKELMEYHQMKHLNDQIDDEEKRKIFVEKDSLCRLLNEKMIDQDFSARTTNCLYYAGIETVGDIVRRTKTDLMKLRNFGKRSLDELDFFVTANGLSFGMDVDRVFRERLDLLRRNTDDVTD